MIYNIKIIKNIILVLLSCIIYFFIYNNDSINSKFIIFFLILSICFISCILDYIINLTNINMINKENNIKTILNNKEILKQHFNDYSKKINNSEIVSDETNDKSESQLEDINKFNNILDNLKKLFNN